MSIIPGGPLYNLRAGYRKWW